MAASQPHLKEKWTWSLQLTKTAFCYNNITFVSCLVRFVFMYW
jgi:hypothetical protein